MTLQEAVKAFDRVQPLDEDKVTIDGEHVGIPYCCDLPVVIDSRDGISRIYCAQCRREISRGFLLPPLSSSSKEWGVSNWGTKGPFRDLYAADIFEALEKAVRLIREWHGINMRDDAERQAWQLYQANAPEMKPIMSILRGENRRPR